VRWVEGLSDNQVNVLKAAVALLRKQDSTVYAGDALERAFERLPMERILWMHVNVVGGTFHSPISAYGNNPNIDGFIEVKVTEVL